MSPLHFSPLHFSTFSTIGIGNVPFAFLLKPRLNQRIPAGEEFVFIAVSKK